MRNPVLIAATASLLAGCAAAAPTRSRPPLVAGPALTGTEWTLVYFQSPEDSIGKVSPKPGEVYTLRLSPDGTMAAGLFCNRGTGHWSSPEAGAAMGTISLNLVAVTQAACLPSPLERIGADFARVRSFVIRDGRLHLNLMVDGGDYVWEPAR
ncbi:MAG TPA: META domain-containing protein [Sphingomicrobium sp.]|nr:META domain-containing protein [Sphingomicrobium sp.]